MSIRRFSALPVLIAFALCPAWTRAGLIEGESDVASANPGLFTGMNVNAFLGATRFYSAGYTGTRANIANVEGGHVWNGHRDLDAPGQVRYIPAAPNTVANLQGTNAAIDRHATWVGSHLNGRGDLGVSAEPYRYGIAHGATLYSGSVASQFVGQPYSGSFNLQFEDVGDTYGKALTGTNGGVNGSGLRADVVNSSWGFSGSTGTRTDVYTVDSLINQSGGVAVFSAGNDGPGTNTVGGIAAGYNAITVGALGNANSYDTVASFSSRGPNDWFQATSPTTGTTVSGARARVDIAAPGEALTAAYYGGATGGNTGGTSDLRTNLYSNVAGTSFAAPIVAGGAALIVDAGKDIYAANANAVDGRVVKAVLLDSADKTPGWNNGQANVNVGGDDRIRTTQSLDYNVGAGRMNLDKAFDQYVDVAHGGQAGTADLAGAAGGAVAEKGWDFGTVGEGLSNLYYLNDMLLAGTDFTTTLSWFVERSVANYSGTGDREAHFANLDLRVFRFDDLLKKKVLDVVAESMSVANTTEHLFFTVPTTGFYGIEVNYLGDNWDFVGRNAEDYGLAWSGTAAPAAAPEPGSLVLSLLVAGPAAGVALRRRRTARAETRSAA